MARENVSQGQNVSSPKSTSKEEIRGIVHILGKDIKGQVQLDRALRQVKGVGARLSLVFADVISREMNVPKDIQIGRLSEEQVEKIEEIIKSPSTYGVPSFLFNRRKDLETGKDMHLAGSDVVFVARNDIERQKTLYTWRGYRHAYGQKVRGQCTRTSGRKGLTVGVTKTKVAQAAGAQKSAEQKAAAKPAKK